MNYIGIDIGGSQLRVAAYDENGTEIKKVIMPNDRTMGPRENCNNLIAAIDSWDISYEGIGIGTPGPLDFRTGMIINPPNLPGWENFNIVRYFEQATKHRAFLNNDANLAGLAEAVVGAGRGYESVFYITVSTGVGGAYIYRGQLINGANSSAAELYTLIVNENTEKVEGNCEGALADQTSGTALARYATRWFKRPVDAKELFDLWRTGDAMARAIVEKAAESLAKGVANTSFIVDPDIFIFGGSVALFNPDFINLVLEKAMGYVLRPGNLHFELATCGGDAGLIGAARHAASELAEQPQPQPQPQPVQDTEQSA